MPEHPKPRCETCKWWRHDDYDPPNWGKCHMTKAWTVYGDTLPETRTSTAFAEGEDDWCAVLNTREDHSCSMYESGSTDSRTGMGGTGCS